MSEIPAVMQLAWGVRDRPPRGPKPTMSLELVVAGGVAVASEEGLAAVSMGRVAKELGASTMALYRYVTSKDDLLELMVDAALGQPPTHPTGSDWRAGLRLWAEAARDRYRAHPWTLRVPITGPPLGPNNVRWLEFGLSALTETPLAETQKVSIVLLLGGFVRNEETLTTDVMAHVKRNGGPPPDYGKQLAGLIEEREFPALNRAVVAGALGDDDPDDIGMDAEFEFGLERILDGVAVLIDAHPQQGRGARG
jgi:AcrR family transcriptional regulator